MKLYIHPRCSTCKKAIQFLDDKNLNYTTVDITEHPPSKQELKKMLHHLDGEIRKLFNTSGQLYRELGIKDKLPSMSDEEALQLLVKNGMLVKRPFLLTDDVGLVGFRLQAWQEALS